MNVKLLISEATLRAALDSRIGETTIGEATQFFPCGCSGDRQNMLEFFLSDIFNEHDTMSILISKTDSYSELISTGDVVSGQKFVLAKRKLKFRHEGKNTL
jgi:hypothetical protein